MNDLQQTTSNIKKLNISPSTHGRQLDFYSETLDHLLIEDYKIQDNLESDDAVVNPIKTPTNIYHKPSGDYSFEELYDTTFLKGKKIKNYLVIEIFEGIHILREWKCSDILETINYRNYLLKPSSNESSSSKDKSHILSTSTNYEKINSLNENDINFPDDSKNRNEIKGAGKLTYRDCRQVLNDVQQVPSIEIRRHCIVICLPPVTSFILHDRVFLLVVENLKADSLLQQLIHLSLTIFKSDSKIIRPFEFFALECVISAAFQHLNEDIMSLEQQFNKLEKNIQKSKNPTTIILEQLHELKQPISTYIDRVNGFDKAFNLIIADIDEIKYMELTRYFLHPNLYFKNRKNEEPNQDLLILLEYFDQELDQYHDRIHRLNESINNADRLLSLRLSINRNQLIKYDIGISLFEAFIALGMCISGIFGMNLKSGIEDNDNFFIIVTTIITILVLLVLPLIFLVWKHINL